MRFGNALEGMVEVVFFGSPLLKSGKGCDGHRGSAGQLQPVRGPFDDLNREAIFPRRSRRPVKRFDSTGCGLKGRVLP